MFLQGIVYISFLFYVASKSRSAHLASGGKTYINIYISTVRTCSTQDGETNLGVSLISCVSLRLELGGRLQILPVRRREVQLVLLILRLRRLQEHCVHRTESSNMQRGNQHQHTAKPQVGEKSEDPTLILTRICTLKESLLVCRSFKISPKHDGVIRFFTVRRQTANVFSRRDFRRKVPIEEVVERV